MPEIDKFNCALVNGLVTHLGVCFQILQKFRSVLERVANQWKMALGVARR